MTDLIPMEKPIPVKPKSALARIADRPLPTRRHLVASMSWWSSRLVPLLVRAPLLVLAELRPIFVGMGRLLVSWSRWCSCTELAEAVKKAEGNQRSKDTLLLEKRKSARLVISGVVFVVAAGVGVWLGAAQPMWGLGVLFALVVVFDAVGRSRRGPAEEKAPLLPTGPIVEGIPLSSLRAEITKSFDEQGVEATIDLPYPVEHGWTVDYHTRAAMKDDYMRQLERDLNVRRNGITQIVEKGQAARGTLHVLLRDPLAAVVDSPESGVLSIFQPLPLGVTASGQEWQEHFLRTHFAVIGASQSGKSSCLWQITDVLRRCPEQEQDAIDLTEGPAFGATRRAFRKRAFDEAGAKQILTEAVALCKTRNAELNRLAEADDTPDEFEEKWRPTAADPQRTILIDEFARLAENRGLLALVEYLLRYGAKAAVTVGIAGQGSTLADFGTSVVRGQVMLKIMFACGKDDVLWLFGKDARDSGYRPDLFEPANGEDIMDAGKCFVKSSMTRTPEPRRAYRLEQFEVRRRDRELGGSTASTVEVLDAIEVPPILAAVELAFAEAGNPERTATADLLVALRGQGVVVSERSLAEYLRPTGLRPREERWRPMPKANPVRGYYLDDVRAAVRGLR